MGEPRPVSLRMVVVILKNKGTYPLPRLDHVSLAKNGEVHPAGGVVPCLEQAGQVPGLDPLQGQQVQDLLGA